ncbi:MAG: DUF393 domain-containing protein [Planctomycetota bacterium]
MSSKNQFDSDTNRGEGSLPGPDDRPLADLIIFDGQCNFCQSQVRRIRWFSGDTLAFISLHDPRVRDDYPDLSHQQLMQQMYVVTKQKERLGGVRGIRYLSRNYPRLWWAAPLLHIPGSLNFWQWLYDKVAFYRYWLGGKANCCDGNACQVHFENPKQESSV